MLIRTSLKKKLINKIKYSKVLSYLIFVIPAVAVSCIPLIMALFCHQTRVEEHAVIGKCVVTLSDPACWIDSDEVQDKSLIFYISSAAGLVIFALVFYLYAVSKMTKRDVKNWVYVVPLVYLAGLSLIVVFYGISWWCLGHYVVGDHHVVVPFQDVMGALYFSAVASTTVGFGDVTPFSDARVFLITQIVTSHLYSIFVITYLVAKIGEAAVSSKRAQQRITVGRRKMLRTLHGMNRQHKRRPGRFS